MIIGLTGISGSGKSTIANILQKKYNFTELSFADTLKDACKIIFNLSQKQLYGTQSEKEMIDPFWGVSPRQIFQTVGTKLFREELPRHLPSLSNIWIKNMETRISLIENNYDIVISDVRFQDELDYIKNRGGVILRVTNSNVLIRKCHEHKSEKEIINLVGIDYEINNHGSIEELIKTIDTIMIKLSQKTW